MIANNMKTVKQNVGLYKRMLMDINGLDLINSNFSIFEFISSYFIQFH